MWKVDFDFTHLLQTSSLHLRYLLTAEGNYRGNEKLNFHRTISINLKGAVHSKTQL